MPAPAARRLPFRTADVGVLGGAAGVLRKDAVALSKGVGLGAVGVPGPAGEADDPEIWICAFPFRVTHNGATRSMQACANHC